ncbi:zinc finger protein 808-like [Plodia interpunctella]|uniref:zinc finger protein 808-like n=1 Tax=Plodia interpunctella TaxID=58824 RepID=UPI00310129A7
MLLFPSKIDKQYSEMYSVKVELNKNDVCYGCLSSNRQLNILKCHVPLFYTLLEQQVGNAKILLCWECKAILEKICKFKKRIQRAQHVLQQTYFTVHETQEKLSTLLITRKDSYDRMICYDENQSKPCDTELEYEVPVELANIIEENNETDVNIKEELVDDLYDDLKFENDSTEGTDVSTRPTRKCQQERKMCEENIDVDYKPPILERKESNYFARYMDKVTISNGNVDEDIKRYCGRLTLQVDQIDELLEKEQLENRPGMKRDRPYKCKECTMAYRRDIDLKRHITFKHMDRTGRVVCKQCKKSCSDWQLLDDHWSQYHNKYFKCILCGFTSPSNKAVVYHIDSAHTKKFMCNTCNDQFCTMKQFKKHYQAKHERLVCDDCGKTFIKRKSFETHYKRHHMPPTCEVCNKTYSTYHNLENHYRLNHPEFINCENRQELAYCVECNKQFPSVYKYRRHLTSAAVHTPPKVEIVPCPECGKVFSRKIRMTNHVLAVHRKNTKHRCDICNKTFCSAYSAKTHRKYTHEKEQKPKNKFCDICGRGFNTNRILNNHRRTHTGERPYSCPHCPATFAQRVAMRTHAKTQHKNLLLDAANQVINGGIFIQNKLTFYNLQVFCVKIMEEIFIDKAVYNYQMCKVCLSSDRTLTPLGKYLDLFTKICPKLRAAYKTGDVLLCWECQMVLQKVEKFRVKVIKAQSFFKTAGTTADNELNQSSFNLSSLQIVLKTNINYYFEEEFTQPSEVIEVESIKKESYDSNYVNIYCENNIPDDKTEIINDVIKEEKIDINEEILNNLFDIDTEFKGEIDDDDRYGDLVCFDVPKTKKKKKKVKKPKNEHQGRPYIIVYNSTDGVKRSAEYRSPVVSQIYDKVAIEMPELMSLREKEKNMKHYVKMEYKCELCISGFSNLTTYKAHMITHNRRYAQSECMVCRQQFTDKRYMDIHYEQHKFKYVCRVCGETYLSKRYMHTHVRHAHDKAYACKECGEQFSNAKEVIIHRKKHREFICDHCGKKTSNKHLIEKHIIMRHLPHKCETCNVTFKSNHTKQNHIREQHVKTRTEEAFCVECNMQFDNVLIYKRHLKSSVKHNPKSNVKYPCPECNKLFNKKMNMKYHYSYFHTDRTNFYCEMCAKYFLNNYQLRRHKSVFHDKIKPVKNKFCPHCGRGFSERRVLNNHIRTHTGERPYACALCSATFTQAYPLTTHMRAVHKVGGLRKTSTK